MLNPRSPATGQDPPHAQDPPTDSAPRSGQAPAPGQAPGREPEVPAEPDPRTAAALRHELGALLEAPAREWLDGALAEAGARTPGWERHVTVARRRCGRPAAPVVSAVRAALLLAARADAATATRLYEQGTSAERQAVLQALPHLPVAAREAAPLVEDALRANDTGLVAAAVGPCAAQFLDAHAWRHAVLKCLFTGVPLTAVAGLARRARGDAELARMLTAYARERTAASRAVPADLHRALELAQAPVRQHPEPRSAPPEES